MRTLVLTSVSLLVLAACGGGGSPTSGEALTPAQAEAMSVADLGDRLVDDTEELGALLASIDSEADAEAARPRIEAMVADYRVLEDRLNQLENADLSFGDAAALMRRAPTLASNARIIAVEVERLRKEHPEASDLLGRILDDL